MLLYKRLKNLKNALLAVRLESSTPGRSGVYSFLFSMSPKKVMKKRAEKSKRVLLTTETK